ncbi:hypothetical protein D3C73_1398860 [compost metagenome]
MPVEDAQGGAGAEELPGEVDADHVVPVGERHVHGWRVFLQAGIGHQDVQGAEGFEGFYEQVFDVLFLRHVRAYGDRAATLGGDVLGQSFGGLAL